MRNQLVTAIVLAAGALYALPVHAGAAPEEVASMLYDRGYRHIQIDPGHAPGYRAYACKQETHFRVEINPAGNIVDVDPVGECDDDDGPERLHVQAPFTDVKIGKNGLRVRAPFVDLRIR